MPISHWRKPKKGDNVGNRRLRILLAEDMHMVRGALVALLELEPDLEVVAVVDRGT